MMANAAPRSGDIGTVAAATAILADTKRRPGFRQLLPFLGPAFVAAVAYVDPGNFATNIQGGAEYGYLLLWVVVASNLMAMLIQVLSAKVGIATGKNLAEICRDRFPKPVTYAMWVLMEAVAMATDLAEFLGAALGFNLLLHIPLIWGAVLTGITTFAILALDRFGFRPIEAIITALVGVIASSYLVEIFLVKPNWGDIAYHAVVPSFAGQGSVLLAAGILGATVMPHVIFLHSSLTQHRVVVREPQMLRRLYKFEIIDVGLAMSIAGMVNAAMLVMAASTFFSQGLTHVATIEEAHQTLAPLLGEASSWVFAISLLASGLSSSAVGTMSGQVIMDGFLHWHIPAWIRRLATMAPSFIVILAGYDATKTLILSQVVLSFGLPFAVIPLVWFTSRKDIMGVLTNRRLTTIVAALVATLIVGLNLFLLYDLIF